MQRNPRFSFTRNHNFLLPIIILWLGLEYYGLGVFSFFKLENYGDSFLPRYINLKQMLTNGTFGYWYPYGGSGVDRLSNDMLYSFEALLFSIFPGWVAYQIIVITKISCSVYFTFLFSRSCLNLTAISSIFAGIIFTLNTNNNPAFILGIEAVPLVLWIFEKKILPKQGLVIYFLAAVSGLLFSFVSSLTFTLPFAISTIFAWFIIVRGKTKSLKFWTTFSVFCCFALLFQLQALISMVAHVSLSHRASGQYFEVETLSQLFTNIKRGLLHYKFTFLSIWNLSWLNWITSGVILLGFVKAKLSNKTYARLLGLILLLCTLSWFFTYGKTFLPDHAQFVKGFDFSRYDLFIWFLSALAAAISLDILSNKWNKSDSIKLGNISIKIHKLLSTSLVLVLIFTSLNLKKAHLFYWLTMGTYVFNYGNVNIENLAKKYDKSPPFRVATVVGETTKHYFSSDFFTPYSNYYGLETSDGFLSMYPKSYQMFWSKVVEPVSNKKYPNTTPPLPKSRFYLRLFMDFMPSELEPIRFRDYFRLNLLSLANTRFIFSMYPLDDERLTLIAPAETKKPQKISVSLSSQTLQSKIKKWGMLLTKDNIIKNFSARKDLYIYRNEAFLPRFYIANNIKIFENTSILLDTLGTSELSTLKNTLFVEKKYVSFLGTGNGSPTIKHYSIHQKEYTPDKIVLNLTVDGSGFLIVSNTYSKYWKCLIDGKEVKIVPAYHTFWGVPITKNTHEVKFYYSPPYKI